MALGGVTTAVSVFVNSTNISTNIETAVLSTGAMQRVVFLKSYLSLKLPAMFFV